MNDAVQAAALKVVGQRPIRPDGADKVTGRANFGADLRLPGMLTGRVKRSPHAHARIVRIDTTAAAALPGVKAIVTAADFAELGNEAVEHGDATARDLGGEEVDDDVFPLELAPRHEERDGGTGGHGRQFVVAYQRGADGVAADQADAGDQGDHREQDPCQDGAEPGQ